MLPLRIGSTSEYIFLQLPEKPSADGWLQGNVSIAVQGFTASLSAYFEASDFSLFETELRSLYTTLNGKAELSPVETQVVVCVKGNGLGGMKVTGQAWSQACYGNKLQFDFEIDQTFLGESLSQLQAIASAYSNADA